VGIAEVDTRALTRRLRDTGAMVGVICTDPAVADADLLAQARAWTLDGKDMISVVSTPKQYRWTAATDDEWCVSDEHDCGLCTC
jgi:carbamoyl-phosphate synthase small subunit